jgi:glycosyltransferase involved in cell wall biosynthesis
VNIAIVGPAHPFPGGSAQHTTELAHRLTAAGHRVSLLSWRAFVPRLLYPGLPTVAEPEVAPFPDTERTLAWHRPDGWWRLGRRLGRDFDAALLAVFTSAQVPAYLVMASLARRGGCRVVALCHNVLPHERRPGDVPLMRALLRRADAAVVHSAEQAELAAALTTTPAHAATMPLHLPLGGRSEPASGGPRPVRHRLLFFGMVRRYKGLDILLRALVEVRPDVSLTVAGEIWTGRAQLRGLISRLRLGGRVTMPDSYVPAADVAGHFGTADALVLPYRSGTASQNALIALHFGVPVIATRVGAIGAAIDDGVNGILCTPGDPADLARAINRLYEPGVLEWLRQGVQPPDTGPAWARYVGVIERACAGTT